MMIGQPIGNISYNMEKVSQKIPDGSSLSQANIFIIA